MTAVMNAPDVEVIVLEQQFDEDLLCDCVRCDEDAAWVGVCSCGCQWLYCDPHHSEWVLRSAAGYRWRCSRCRSQPVTVQWVQL